MTNLHSKCCRKCGTCKECGEWYPCTTVINNEPTYQKIAYAYRELARKALYRPAAPSDGFGNITGPLNLKAEVATYIEQYITEIHGSGTCFVGFPEIHDIPALIYTVEAIRNLSAVNHPMAKQLLKMALQELEKPRRSTL